MECAVGKQAAFKAESFVAPEHQQQAQQQDAMEKKKICQKKGSPTLTTKHHLPLHSKKRRERRRKKKAHRKGFCTLNKFAFSICSSFEKNVILFDVYSLGV